MKRWAIHCCMGLATAAVAMQTIYTPTPRLVYNATDSVPIGWYRITSSASLRIGDIVLARLPAQVAAFAGQRGYLPVGVPILKRIGAVSPQRVCIHDNAVSVDDHIVAIVLTTDGQGRVLPKWAQCRALVDGELFLLSNTNPASFDSRYFGPIAASNVIGDARPLSTWTAP